MKDNASSIRVGNFVKINNDIYKVVKTQHVKPGKGGAFSQMELKNIATGTKKNERFRSNEQIEKAVISGEKHTFLYSSADDYIFMNDVTFDQITVDKKIIGEDADFLKEDMHVQIEFYEGRVISISLPEKIFCQIKSTQAVIKGQTASGSFKPAILDMGKTIMVPPHIKDGDTIFINAKGQYLERAKK